MKRNVMLLLITTLTMISLGVLAGCKKENHSWQDQDQPIKSVKWFKKHNAERKAQLAACRSNPSKLAITPNCANASDAD
ncbi:EexN family lipoprotein [Xylella fastidiosa]|uniref:Plasmid protein n=2 Tax=Xylella fastidiosa TaxID=2371 RepID=A0A9Q4MJ15_XYLFS|nr:EexN family lipoprotein [Xylella fastidiosa]KFA40309.1 plasmid protein [Xylella fastidiosa]MBE0269288.1 EexN family lipoprotein [Xylella fastidiosa subsp. multiplex]MBE0275959.1 EexN family lipoprotein [Xylella fastidiosa subsp. multiplex]MBE0278127.1 EexN family lipoprotein [Xylella fastidiosa subsp. multiplex]MBE0282550.1 EexN family lipoprotein [Xylella fastidiosa subsp. multiplex]